MTPSQIGSPIPTVGNRRGNPVARVALNLGDDMVESASTVQRNCGPKPMALRKNDGRDEDSLRFGALRVDLATREACRAGQPLEFTPASYRILVALLHAAPDLVSCSQLECEIGIQWLADRDTLAAHADALRAVLDAPFAWPMLVTIRGVGYRLADADAK